MKGRLFRFRICGARRARGGYCRAPAMRGKLRCRVHGGKSTGPTSEAGKSRAVAAMTAGRRAWVTRMRTMKATGVIRRFPGGRRKGKTLPRTGDRIVDRAQRLVENALAMVEQSPAVKALRAKEWDELTAAERLQRNTLDALTVTRDILARPLNWDKPKEVSIIKDAALSAAALQARVDELVLRPQRSLDKMSDLLQRLRAGDGAKVIEADNAAPTLAPSGTQAALLPRAASAPVTIDNAPTPTADTEAQAAAHYTTLRRILKPKANAPAQPSNSIPGSAAAAPASPSEPAKRGARRAAESKQ